MEPSEVKSKIKFLALDVDGVLTDGGMYYSNSGDEFKKFNTKDGLGIKRLVASGMNVAFISNGINDVLIRNRAKLLGVQYVYVGLDKKTIILEQWIHELQLDYSQIAYIGDDINDLEIIDKVGFSACPNDAVKAVKEKANTILNTKGGEGCVREFIDTYFF